MKVRRELSAREIEQVHESLTRRLGDTSVPTLPQVAMRIIDLISDPTASVADFTETIRTDQALTGRLLRMANSAAYGQRSPVTKVERAMVLIGIEKLKALALGFHLSKVAFDKDDFSFRRIWPQWRCGGWFASRLAERAGSDCGGEAFVVGLLCDAGVPMMPKLIGSAYKNTVSPADPPAKQNLAESATLPYTHVDVATALTRLWKLPEALARPIASHHTPPSSMDASSAASVLHAATYLAGMIPLDPNGSATVSQPVASTARRLFGMDEDEVTTTIGLAAEDFDKCRAVFTHIIDTSLGLEAIVEQAGSPDIGALQEIQDNDGAEITGVVDATCADMFVRTLGRRPFRRALTDAEAGRYVAVAGEAASTLGDFHVGLEFALAGLLQSPYFLFRVEIGEPTDDPEHRRYSNHEMASRLSYVLWNTTPDEMLLAAAERGELLDDTGLQTQVDRLLESDRSREAVRNFFDELFVLQRILDEVDVEKNGILFPNFDQNFRESAREETLALLDHHVFEVDGDYRELFTTHTTVLNPALAEHYDVSLTGETPGFEEVSLPPENGRRGLLGHASILSIYAHDEKTSAAIRGRFVRQVLLCGNIPDPPPDVSTTFPPSDARTLRERVEQHLMNDGCADCHARMDPIGLALENFDAAGEWRDTENGATIDPSGVLDGVAFSDAADLGRAIAEHPNVSACLTRSMYRYATGHVETAREEIEILDLTESLATEGHRVRALLGHVVMSRGFREAGEQL